MLIAGSNGKGSTVEMLGSILGRAGYKTGTYFSPQVEEFPERIRVGGKNATRREIADAYSRVSEACRANRIEATFFEVVTAMALLIFRARKVDFAVLEVGLGGRLDATNAVEPALSIITSISLEHTDVLGKTLSKIAKEKCGVARRGKPLVLGHLPPEAKRAISKACKKAGAKQVFTQDEAKISSLRQEGGAYSFKAAFRGKEHSISLPAPGSFQVKNALCALCAASLLGAGGSAIEKGLAEAKPKFRLEKIASHPTVIADCAHNPEAAAALSAELPRLLSGKKSALLFSAMSDKEYPLALGTLARHFSKAVLTEVSLSRSASLKDLGEAAKKSGISPICIRSPKKAFAKAKSLAGKGGIVVVAGSMYLLSELFGRDKIRIAQ